MKNLFKLRLTDRTDTNYYLNDGENGRLVIDPICEVDLLKMSTLSFKLPISHPKYNSFTANNVYQQVIDLVDYETDKIIERFRVYDVNSTMDSEGRLYKTIECESAFGWLNDFRMPQTKVNRTPEQLFAEIVNTYITGFSKNPVTNKLQNIRAGTVKVRDSVNGYKTSGKVFEWEWNSEACNTALLRLCENFGGYVFFTITSDGVAINWYEKLDDFMRRNVATINLGVNQLNLEVDFNATEIYNRIRGLGATDTSVKPPKQVTVGWIEDKTSQQRHGIKEYVLTDGSIKKYDLLRQKCETLLNKHKTPQMTIQCGMIDLSWIDPNVNRVWVGDEVTVYNSKLGVNTKQYIYKMTVELHNPFNPKIQIANRSGIVNDYVVREENLNFGYAVQNDAQIELLHKELDKESSNRVSGDAGVMEWTDWNFLRVDCTNSPLTGTLKTQAVIPERGSTYSLGDFGKGFSSIHGENGTSTFVFGPSGIDVKSPNREYAFTNEFWCKGNILPWDSRTWSLGSIDVQWKNLYVQDGSNGCYLTPIGFQAKSGSSILAVGGSNYYGAGISLIGSVYIEGDIYSGTSGNLGSSSAKFNRLYAKTIIDSAGSMGSTNYILKSNGNGTFSWTDHIGQRGSAVHGVATTSTNGFMSYMDKQNLNSLVSKYGSSMLNETGEVMTLDEVDEDKYIEFIKNVKPNIIKGITADEVETLAPELSNTLISETEIELKDEEVITNKDVKIIPILTSTIVALQGAMKKIEELEKEINKLKNNKEC